MMNARKLLFVAVAAALPLGLVTAQEALRPVVKHNVKAENITIPGEFDVVQQVIELAPGASSPVHSHGGPEMTLVTEGEVTLTMDKDGSSRAYKAGEMYVVPANTFMMVSNKGKEKATFVVTFLLPEGAKLTTPK